MGEEAVDFGECQNTQPALTPNLPCLGLAEIAHPADELASGNKQGCPSQIGHAW